MGQSYEQIKEGRHVSKRAAITDLLLKKGSRLEGLEGMAVVVVKPKGRRGRPPKAKLAEVFPASESAPPKKKRGRPKGSKNKKKTTTVSAPVVAAVVKAEPKKRGRKKGPPNDKEIAVMKCLNGGGRRFKSFSIEEMARVCFPDEALSDGRLWVRTSLRRPVGEGWVEKASRGEYRMNAEGRSALKGLIGG